jgi:predicted amidophosphoribosyltransferase
VATVGELSDPYANFMLNPLPPGTPNVCRVCTTFTQGYDTCYRCGFDVQYLDTVLPISYSVHYGQLHTALAGYKRSMSRAARRFQLQLAAVLWRFLARHEGCLANTVGVDSFGLVTTVPSGNTNRDATHPLRHVVGELVEPMRGRYDTVLRRSRTDVHGRSLDTAKYEPTRPLDGEDVLLVDDTWTTGGSAQSAAAALLGGGAGKVGLVVIGRHVHEKHEDNEVRLNALPTPFDWDRCALE